MQGINNVKLLKVKQFLLRFRNTENMITYMDREIDKVQEQLKSIKNIHKIQAKGLNDDV